MTTLTESFSPLFQLSRGTDRLLGRNAEHGSYIPAADIVVSAEHVTVTMDVPGLQADLGIELENDVLTRPRRARLPGRDRRRACSWQRLERGFDKFERGLKVPRGLDPDAIEASLDVGVLTLRIPKPENLKPKRVQIAAGKVQGARSSRAPPRLADCGNG